MKQPENAAEMLWPYRFHVDGFHQVACPGKEVHAIDENTFCIENFSITQAKWNSPIWDVFPQAKLLSACDQTSWWIWCQRPQEASWYLTKSIWKTIEKFVFCKLKCANRQRSYLGFLCIMNNLQGGVWACSMVRVGPGNPTRKAHGVDGQQF